MSIHYIEYTLSEASVDMVSNDVQDYLNKQHMEGRSVQRVRLTVEELLLNLLAHCGRGLKLSVGLGKQFGRYMLRLRYEAEPFDPSKGSDDPLADEMMRSLGLFPAWTCRGRLNTVSLVLANRPKRGTLFYILLAAMTAVILGALGNVIPENVRLIVNDAVLSPLASSFLGLLNTFAGLMIFLTICSGILGIGDSATLGRMGTSVVARFIVLLFAISAMSAIVVLPFVSLNTSSVGQERTSAFGQISRMFFDILPSNMIDPFRTGNTFQIIVIAAFTGCALLAIGERGSRVRGLIGEASILFQQIVSSVCALVPLFVFGMLLQLIWSGQVYVLSFAFKQIILIVFFDIALTMTAWIISSLRLKCPPILLLKKVLPVFLVAFTSASSVSAFQIGMETCERELGVDRHLTSFIYPLGSVIFMPTSVVYFTVLVCTFAETYQIPVNASWLIMAVMMSALIAIAMPPVPGADILCHSVLFSGLGIPAEAFILATAASIAIDHLDTGTNVMVMIFQIVCEAKRLDKLDRGILLGKVKGTAM